MRRPEAGEATQNRASILIAAAACSADERDGAPTSEVADSASIRVVTYSALDSTRPSLVVDTVPAFPGGVGSRGAALRADRVRRGPERRRIAVVDGQGTQEIVLLDQHGAILDVLGGRGQGPGEHMGIRRVVTDGANGFIAQDYAEARVTRYHGTEPTETYGLHFFDHKTVLGTTEELVVFGPPLMIVQGRLYPEPWRRVAITTSRAPFQIEDTLAVVDWDQSLDFHGRDPWAASGPAAFDGERVIYGRGDRAELTWYGLDGQPVQIVRWRSAPEPVSDSALAEFEEDFLASVEGRLAPDAARGSLDRMRAQHRGTIPYFDHIFADASGTVWIGEFLRPEQRTAEHERTYFLFSRDGEAQGAVRLPAELRVRDITTDLVVEYELGPYGEPAAVGYAIRRPQDR